ncbi:MAG: PAS domain-containing protein [Chloroflexi bacterium]|nr:PAS domain-containing protein [Chloroflexota bacterium]
MNEPEPNVVPLSNAASARSIRDLPARAQAESVRPVALGLAILYALFAVSHLLLFSPAIRVTMSLVAGFCALAYLILFFIFRTRPVPVKWVQPISALLFGIAVFHAALRLYLSGELLQSANLALCIIAGGIFFLSARWYALTTGVTLVLWLVITAMLVPASEVLSFSPIMLGAVAVSMVAFVLRNRALNHLERLQQEADAQTLEVERATASSQRAELLLKEAETRFRNLVEQLPAVTFVDALDASASTIYVSPQIRDMTGYSPAEWIADPKLWEKLLHPQDRARVLEATLKHNSTGEPFDAEYRLVARDGHMVWIHDKAVRDAILKAVSFAAAAFLRAPQWEQHSGEVLARLGEAAQVSRVYIFENHRAPGDILLSSQRYEWCAPGAAPQIDNPTLQNAAVQESGFGRWAKLLGAGETVHGHVRDFPASERALLNAQQILSLVVMPIFVGGEWWGFIGFDSCVQEHTWSPTELDALQTAANTLGAAIQRERVEHALAEARDQALEGSRLKSEFLAMMSHEIRTPMNSIVAMSELLLETDLTGEQRELAKQVRRSAEGLMTIINDILDLSKIEAGKLALERVEFYLPHLVLTTAEILGTQARDKGLSLHVEISPELPQNCIGDAGRLRQVLLNLLSNAVKFTERGQVVVQVNPASESSDAQAATELTRRVQFTVCDTGIGLSPGTLPHLFQPFTQADMSITRRFGGTGLGLAISKRLVELMGGEIGVTSTPGQGSTFWFTLPLQVRQTNGLPAKWLAPQNHAVPTARMEHTDMSHARVSATALDTTVIAQMRALETGAQARALNDLLQVFMEDTGHYVSQLEQHIAAGDVERLHHAAHSIKGNAAGLGAYRLSQQAARIERVAKQNATRDAAELVPELRDEFERVKAALKLELQRAPALDP